MTHLQRGLLTLRRSRALPQETRRWRPRRSLYFWYSAEECGLDRPPSSAELGASPPLSASHRLARGRAVSGNWWADLERGEAFEAAGAGSQVCSVAYCKPINQISHSLRGQVGVDEAWDPSQKHAAKGMEGKHPNSNVTRKPPSCVETILNTASPHCPHSGDLPSPNTEGFWLLASPDSTCFAVIHRKSSQPWLHIRITWGASKPSGAQVSPPEILIQLVWGGALASVVFKTPWVILNHSQGYRPLI